MNLAMDRSKEHVWTKTKMSAAPSNLQPSLKVLTARIDVDDILEMFHVGRYDPKKEENRTKTKGNKEVRGSKRSTSNKRKRQRTPDSSSTGKTSKSNLPEAYVTSRKNDDESCDSDSSSSVPSSTSSEESQLEEAKTGPSSTLRVIAPSTTSNTKRQKIDMLDDEGFDDFDIDAELLDTVKDFNEVPNEEKAKAKVDESTLSDEIKTALHMSCLPIEQAAAAWDLAPFLIENLKRDGYESFFPIQSLVIPDVIASERHSHIRARDVCVAAPTGSGKTLGFVLPVLNALSKRQVRRLRALVILPSRDLASQVYNVFERYTHGSDLRVGLAIGQSDFKAEQRALIVGSREASVMEDIETVRRRLSLSNHNLDLALEAFPGFADSEAPPSDGAINIPAGGISAVDVLVCTPGRLVDHLDRTPGFTLQHLRFCIIDEADRLVNQSYHNWIGRVISSANEASVKAWHEINGSNGEESTSSALRLSPDESSFVIDPITWRRGGTAGDASSFSNNDSGSSVVASVCRPTQLRKLLFSATLTKDPQKLASLGLVNPKHYDAHQLTSGKASSQRYSMPPSLSEYTVECTAEQKPLVLLALLLGQLEKGKSTNGGRNIVAVFTSSLDSTHRLVRLLQLMWRAAGIGDPSSVAEFSSALNQSQRSQLMKRCNDATGNVSVVVCSDGMSRGMDISSVSNVINYDVPSFAKTYVHRCGRTARAGKKGTAISVLKGGQVKQFHRMRKLIDSPDRVKEMNINKELLRNAAGHYRDCVKALRAVIQAEEDGEISVSDDIPSSFLSL